MTALLFVAAFCVGAGAVTFALDDRFSLRHTSAEQEVVPPPVTAPLIPIIDTPPSTPASAVAAVAPPASAPAPAAAPALAAAAAAAPASAAAAASAAAPASAAAAAPASDIPEGKGALKTTEARGGRRIFVDGRTVGQTPATVLVACGVHEVKIGSSGRPSQIDVPCRGEVAVGDF